MRQVFWAVVLIVAVTCWLSIAMAQSPNLPMRPQVNEAFILQTSGTLYNQLIASEQYAQALEHKVMELTGENQNLKERLKKYEEAAPKLPAAAPAN